MGNKPTMFFLLNSLDIHRGGVTKSSLMQANLFAENGYKTFICTFNFNPRYPEIIEKLTSLGKLNPEVTFLNMYDSLKGQNPSVAEQEIPILKKVKDDNLVLDPHHGKNADRVYENGEYTAYIKYDDNGGVVFVDHFNQSRYRTKREEYDADGHLLKISHMDYEANKARQMIFYDEHGVSYLSKWVNPQTGSAIRVNHFENGTLLKIFSNDVELKTSWLESVIERHDHPLVVSDVRAIDPILLKLNSKKTKRIWRLHSNHVGAPFDPMGDFEKTVAPCLNAIDELDAALVLTNEQQEDLTKKMGPKENLFILPHYTDTQKKSWISSIKADEADKDENLAVVITRFAALKQVDHIVKAFRKVVDTKPEAKLELWGYGDEEASLKKLIKDLKLSSNVTIKGFTFEPTKVYSQALFSILTSKTEGFSLGILESMSSGTPVISYDIKYGPRDMISDRENGLIVEKGNIDELATKMLWMFEHPKEAKTFGKRAQKSVSQQYSKEKYWDQWLQVIHYVMNK
ncbi:glycosyltransferase [Rossellomorea marisflavi]|uniref:glycosyltransferase n=1 Tax=Rossellomorea marisflavi TaxID=189381 RepID=UPI0034592FAB